MSNSFPCPSCDGVTGVTDSRPRTLEGGIRRRRSCFACKRRFTTYEVRAEDINSVFSGVQDRRPEVMQQATQVVNALGRLSQEDRILLVALAKRLEGVDAKSKTLRALAANEEEAA